MTAEPTASALRQPQGSFVGVVQDPTVDEWAALRDASGLASPICLQTLGGRRLALVDGPGPEDIARRVPKSSGRPFIFQRITLRGALDSSVVMLVVIQDVPTEHDAKFSKWYEQEHIPLLLENEAFVSISRWRATTTSHYLTLCLVTHEGALTPELLGKVTETEWARLARPLATVLSAEFFRVGGT